MTGTDSVNTRRLKGRVHMGLYRTGEARKPASYVSPLPGRRLFVCSIAVAALVGGGAAAPLMAAAPPVTAPLLADTALTRTVWSKGVSVDGADVVVIAWPNQSVLASLGDDQKVESQVVATAQTDASGGFTVQLDSSSLPKDLVSETGQVDVDVIVADKEHEAERSLSLLATPSGWTSTEVVATDVDSASPIDLQFDLGTGAFQSSAVSEVDLRADPDLLSDEEGLALGPGKASGFSTTSVVDRRKIDTLLSDRGRESGITPMEECYSIATSKYQSQRPESFVIAQGVANAKVKVTQGRGTSHSLGVAVTFGNGWKGSGSTSRSTNSRAAQGGIATARRYYNRVKYRYYTNSCGPGYGYYWRPYSVQELVAGYVLVSRLHYSRCNTYDSGYSYTKDTGRNTTYGTGVDLAQVNVSAQSGYNSDTSLSFGDFTGRAKLCWSSSAGREQSARVVAAVA